MGLSGNIAAAASSCCIYSRVWGGPRVKIEPQLGTFSLDGFRWGTVERQYTGSCNLSCQYVTIKCPLRFLFHNPKEKGHREPLWFPNTNPQWCPFKFFPHDQWRMAIKNSRRFWNSTFEERLIEFGVVNTEKEKKLSSGSVDIFGYMQVHYPRCMQVHYLRCMQVHFPSKLKTTLSYFYFLEDQIFLKVRFML